MQTVPIKVSNALQRVYHENVSQIIFPNFEAANEIFLTFKAAHRRIFIVMHKQY